MTDHASRGSQLANLDVGLLADPKFLRLEVLRRLARRHRSLEGYLDSYTLDPVVTEHLEEQDEADRVTVSTVYVAAASGRNYPHRWLGLPR